MKVLIAANSDMGLYKFRRELVERLVKDKHEVFISLPDGEYIPALREIGCQFIPCEFDRHGTNPMKELQQIQSYKKLLKEVKPDIVFTYTIKPNVYCGAACASMKIPYVANITGLGTAVENGGLLQLITLTLYRFGLRKAQRVFFQNQENKEFMLSKGVGNNSYDMLPGSGVNLQQYEPFEYPQNDTIDFSFISRIMKEKGIDQYLEAAEYIREKYPETRFHIYGYAEPEYKGRLQELIDKGTVIYHGVVSDIAGVHKQSCCTIHPSYYPEGLSNVLLESSACARPIITTDRSGCREVVEDGVNGFVVKQKDSKDLIKQIEKFLQLSWGERKNMGLSGRKKVEKEFNREIVIEKYLKELKEVAN